MLFISDVNSTSLVKHDPSVPISDTTVWLDLLDPTPEEDAAVEKMLNISVPTRAEMREIEASRRLYHENGASYMTAFVVHDTNLARPESSTITFIIAGDRLVTVRYAEPKAFQGFAQRASKGEVDCRTGAAVMTGLMETLIEGKADFIERVQDSVEVLAKGIFDIKKRRSREQRLDRLLGEVGKAGDSIARAQESAASLHRMLHFFAGTTRDRGGDARLIFRIEAAQRDIHSLLEHLKALSERVSFLLNAALGMITTEQNQIIKLFSVMAVMMMPPTLVASIYGMNYRSIPEFSWDWGYEWALGLMLFSAVVPFIYFKRKGWL